MQAELGDIVYVELPEVGSSVTKGESFGVVESVKVKPFLRSLLFDQAPIHIQISNSDAHQRWLTRISTLGLLDRLLSPCLLHSCLPLNFAVESKYLHHCVSSLIS